MRTRQFLFFLAFVLGLVCLTGTPARADLWVIAGTDPGYTAVGGTHNVTLAAPTPDDPETNQEYQKAGPYWDWSWSAPSGLSVSPTAPLYDQSGTMTISGTSSSVGTYSLGVSATGHRYKRLSDSDPWTRYADRTDGYTLTFNFVTVTVQAWNDLLENWESGSSAAEICAGAIPSPAHQTDIMLTASSAHAVEVPVTMSGGTGHASGADADISIGGIDIGPGETDYVTTSGDGTLIGTLTSSDVKGNGVTVTGGGGSASVAFGWDNYTGDDKWYEGPPYIVPEDASDVSVYFAHDGKPMDGHTMLFVVEEVDYYDEYGAPQVAINTPGDPHDLSAWATFDDTDPTDSDGLVYTKIHFTDLCWNAVYMKVTVYDMSVWGQ